MKRQQGFTLIELMMAVVIVGILASIAIPNYQSSVRKSRREDAKGALVAFANAMERHYTEQGNYCDSADADGGTIMPDCDKGDLFDTGKPIIFAQQSPIDGPTKYYDLRIDVVSRTTYTLHATPIGNQADDDCGTFSLTNTGLREVIDSKNGYAKETCW